MDIKLILPTPEYEQQVMALRAELFADGENFAGCSGLDTAQTYAEWLDHDALLHKMYGDNYVPSDVFLAVRMSDDRVVGVIDYRYVLSDFLFKYGGSTGYTVRKDERRKGYATEMLRLVCEKARAHGDRFLIVTCDKENEASRRTILKCGGVFENEVEDVYHIEVSGTLQRYRIDL